MAFSLEIITLGVLWNPNAQGQQDHIVVFHCTPGCQDKCHERNEGA